MAVHDGFNHVSLNQATVLAYLLRRKPSGPCEISFVRFGIDGQRGTVYARSRVLHILRALERKGLVREVDGDWEAT